MRRHGPGGGRRRRRERHAAAGRASGRRRQDAEAAPAVPDRPVVAQPGVAETSPEDAPAEGVPLSTYLLGLAAAAIVVAIATVRPWRFVPDGGSPPRWRT